MGSIHRRRHGNDDEIGVTQFFRFGSNDQVARLRKLLRRDFATGVDLAFKAGDFAGRHVIAQRGLRLAEFNCYRQADVAQSDNRNLRQGQLVMGSKFSLRKSDCGLGDQKFGAHAATSALRDLVRDVLRIGGFSGW